MNICASDEALLSRIHTGFIFDKIIRNDDLYQYMVYFPEFKMINRFTSRHDKENLSAQTFKLYIFILLYFICILILYHLQFILTKFKKKCDTLFIIA